IEIGRLFSIYGLNIFSEVWEFSALPDWRFVVDLPYTLHELVVERRLPDHKALLFGLLCLVACFESELLIPPMFKCRDGQHGEVIPLHRVVILRTRLRYLLQKRE